MGFSLCYLSEVNINLILTKKSKAGSNEHKHAKRINEIVLECETLRHFATFKSLKRLLCRNVNPNSQLLCNSRTLKLVQLLYIVQKDRNSLSTLTAILILI